MKEKKVLTKKEKTREMTLLAMFIAIIALLGLAPSPLGATLGFVRIIGPIEATYIHIPVLIGAALFDKRFGVLLGLAFGVISNIAAFVYSSPYFIYPWVAILPRFIFGLLIVYIVNFFLKVIKNKYLAVGISFFILTLIHTIITLTMLYSVFPWINELSYSWETFKFYIVGFLVPYAGFPIISIIEAVAAGIIGSIIVIRLAKTYNISKYLD